MTDSEQPQDCTATLIVDRVELVCDEPWAHFDSHRTEWRCGYLVHIVFWDT